MVLKIAVQMDAIESINIATDSTYILALEAQKRGYELYYYQPNDLHYVDQQVKATAYQLTLIPEQVDTFFSLSEPFLLSLKEMDVVLVRQDPPFDMAYVTTTYLLESLLPEVLVVNHPAEIRNCPEKWFVCQFSQYMPATIMSRDIELIENFQQTHGEIVLKPLYGCGGQDIFRSAVKDENLSSILATLLRDYKEPLIIQQYLPDIIYGDKRIILIDGEVAGAINRVPQEGEFRANMHVGGEAQAIELDDRDREICGQLKNELQKRELFLVGIDIIGGYLTEINVTSPTGLQEINRFNKVALEEMFWDKIIQKLR